MAFITGERLTGECPSRASRMICLELSGIAKKSLLWPSLRQGIEVYSRGNYPMISRVAHGLLLRFKKDLRFLILPYFCLILSVNGDCSRHMGMDFPVLPVSEVFLWKGFHGFYSQIPREIACPFRQVDIPKWGCNERLPVRNLTGYARGGTPLGLGFWWRVSRP